jgi:hypothetical protein
MCFPVGTACMKHVESRVFAMHQLDASVLELKAGRGQSCKQGNAREKAPIKSRFEVRGSLYVIVDSTTAPPRRAKCDGSTPKLLLSSQSRIAVELVGQNAGIVQRRVLQETPLAVQAILFQSIESGKRAVAVCDDDDVTARCCCFSIYKAISWRPILVLSLKRTVGLIGLDPAGI